VSFATEGFKSIIKKTDMDLEKTLLKIQNLRETAARYMQRKDALEVIGTYFQELTSKIFDLVFVRQIKNM
jgi:hypothetical protein